MSGSGREALPNVREWSGDPHGFLRVVGRPSRMSGSGRESLLDVREWSGDPRRFAGVFGRHHRCPEVVGRP